MSAGSLAPDWRLRRAAQVPQEFFTGARLFMALTVAFIVRSSAFFVDLAVELPDGLAAALTLAAVAIFLLLAPAFLPLEMRSASLVQVAGWPVVGELGRLPAVMRLAAVVATVAVLLPLVFLLADLPARGPQADGLTNLVARSGFVLVCAVVLRDQLTGVRRRHGLFRAR